MVSRSESASASEPGEPSEEKRKKQRIEFSTGHCSRRREHLRARAIEISAVTAFSKLSNHLRKEGGLCAVWALISG